MSAPTASPHEAATAALTRRIVPPVLAGDKTTVSVGGIIRDVAVGGGGRYLLLSIENQRRSLAIFDLNLAKIVRTIRLPTETALVAAGAEKFVVVMQDEGVIQCWSLSTFAKDATVNQPVQGVIRTISMGSDSSGSLLVRWCRGRDPATWPGSACSASRP